MSYIWESVAVCWNDKWNCWSVYGIDASLGSEWLTDDEDEDVAIAEAGHYAFEYAPLQDEAPHGRAKTLEVYRQDGSLRKSYTQESFNEEKFWQQHRKVYLVDVEVRRIETHCVEAESHEAAVRLIEQASTGEFVVSDRDTGWRVVDAVAVPRPRKKAT